MDASSITSINTDRIENEILLFSSPNKQRTFHGIFPTESFHLELKIGKSEHFTEIEQFRDGVTALHLAEKSMMKLKYINFVSNVFFFSFVSMKLKICRRM